MQIDENNPNQQFIQTYNQNVKLHIKVLRK